ncbi:MAG: amino acid carrier protein [Oscillospiraceae bacterium]|nr:amino acid carrier protein [Oscillospiraceae bacterium]
MLWGTGTVALIFGTGIYFTVKLKFFQFRRLGFIFKSTLFAGASENHTAKGENVSRFQALSTALAASMGTGNIIGVASAVSIGGAGAVFWMWASALFGMATAYAENVLGVKYKDKAAPGPMAYLEYGLRCKPFAVVFAAACVLASFGIGNMTQTNAISSAGLQFGISPYVSGAAIVIFAGFIILRGSKSIAKATEKIIPAVSFFYMIGAVLVLFIFRENIGRVLVEIVTSAFGLKAAVGGAAGYAVKQAVTVGLRRGIFSNEAGMGSSVLVHTATGCNDPAVMGMWAVAEVFIDTIVCCTLTALVILSTGAQFDGGEGVAVVVAAFEYGLGGFARYFISISAVIFAFATLLGWCWYGARSLSYLTAGKTANAAYKLLFLSAAYIGAVADVTLIWEISDTLNIFMLLPNIVALIILRKEALAIGN